MNIIFIFIGLIYFILYGIANGIVMTRPMDYRTKKWYADTWQNPWYPVYPVIDFIKNIILIMIVYFSALFPEVRHWLWGIILLGWEFSELAYAYTRNGRAIFRFSENVFGIGLRIWGWPLYTLHFIRILFGITLLWRM